MSDTRAWLDPDGCPAQRPPIEAMADETRALHDGIDDRIRQTGVPTLHPSESTVQLDLLGSPDVVSWQERKAALLFSAEASWAELPQLYGRYGTRATAALIARLRELEAASAALVCDSGMQATAVLFDVLLTPGSHAIQLRQVYNKSGKYLSWLAERIGAEVTVVDDGDLESLAAAIRPETVLVFGETFTNPLMRAQDLSALPALIERARSRAPRIKLVVDGTLATPWGVREPLLESGVDVVVASATKAVGGQDRDLAGYLATRDVDLANAAMDLLAMRGGILDWRRAEVLLAGLDDAERAHERRCHSADRVAAFLARHPRVEAVHHPSLADHPDAAAVARGYTRHGSLLSLRGRDLDEDGARHLADVMATTVVVRYALSFDGLASKVNHHKSVSEYFTPDEALSRSGLDRLVRLAVGVEDPDDLIACLNWSLHHASALGEDELESWRDSRRNKLALPPRPR